MSQESNRGEFVDKTSRSSGAPRWSRAVVVSAFAAMVVVGNGDGKRRLGLWQGERSPAEPLRRAVKEGMRQLDHSWPLSRGIRSLMLVKGEVTAPPRWYWHAGWSRYGRDRRRRGALRSAKRPASTNILTKSFGSNNPVSARQGRRSSRAGTTYVRRTTIRSVFAAFHLVMSS